MKAFSGVESCKKDQKVSKFLDFFSRICIFKAWDEAPLCCASGGFHNPVSLKKTIDLDFGNDHWMIMKKFLVATNESANNCFGSKHRPGLADSVQRL